VLRVLTHAYLVSTWCAAEIGMTLSRGSRVLPVRAEPGVAHPLLTSLQHADVTVDAAAGRAALGAELRRVDASGVSVGPMTGRRFPSCVRWRSPTIRCSSAATLRWSN
jgi:hypothetical protein